MAKQTKSKLAILRWLPYEILLALFVVSLIIAIIALRHNNQTMIRLRETVYQADKSNGDVNGALNNLRQYVYGHMNTNLSSGNNAIKPPIQLKYTYDRLKSAEDQRVLAVNSQIYTDAQYYCQSVNTAYFGTTRVPCVQDYVQTHGVKMANPIPAGLYQFDFISPFWSPDLAGWSLLFGGLSFLGFIAAFLAQRFERSSD